MKTYLEMADSVLARRDRYAVRKKQRQKQLAGGTVCLCLCLLVAVGGRRTGVLPADPPPQLPTGPAAAAPAAPVGPVIEDQKQPAAAQDRENASDKQFLPPETAATEGPVISVDGAPLAPAHTALTRQALYTQRGSLLPKDPPQGFAFESASCTEDRYSVIWYRGLRELNWYIRDYREADAARITSVEDTVNYDLTLYPIPRAESVPEELREMVDDPIFRAEELTPEAVNARAYSVEDAGDVSGPRLRFSVLYGDKLVTVSAKGVQPEWLFEQLSALPRQTDAPMQDEAGATGALTSLEAVWGGSYLEDTGTWVVWLTEDTAANREAAFAQNPGLSRANTLFRQADYSYAYLTQLMADISRCMAEGLLPEVTAAALREDINRVEITMTGENAAAEARLFALDTLGGAVDIRYDGSRAVADADIVKCPAE